MSIIILTATGKKMRQVISKCYCLPHDIVKWLDAIAKKKRRSASSILTELLLETKQNNTTTKK
jgi:hypothetical protein